MLKFFFPTLLFLLTGAAAKLHAQTSNGQLSFSGNYGRLIDQFEIKQFDGAGISLGLEFRALKRFTFGAELDWIGLEPEAEIALPITSLSGEPPVPYVINRHQFNFRGAARYYFKQAFNGLYVGVFGAYSYLTITTDNYPKSEHYYTYYGDPSDDVYAAGGFTYGYRLKLNKSFRASIFGSHQFGADTLYKDRRQQLHQFGLGLNWVFHV